MLRSISLSSTFLLLAWSAVAFGAENVVDIRDCGAKPDGKTLCTAAIQKAIDRCAGDGGGTVYLPPGTWLSGTIFLKSRVALQLEAGCTLLGSANPADYPEQTPSLASYTDKYVRQSLIGGQDLDQVAIRGRGTIDGQGEQFRWKEYKNRPYVIRLINCRDVLVEDITLRNSPMWMQHYLACQRVTVRGIRVDSTVTYNNDGLDIDGCRDVSISGCTIDSGDDAICLKSTCQHSCQDVTVTNCTLRSTCNALKMGTESNGGFQNVTINNCTISSPRGGKTYFGNRRGLAGVAMEIVDGGTLDRVAISNLTIDGVATPIFVRLGNRARPYAPGMPKPDVGTLRNVVLSNIVATNASAIGCPIAGIPGHPVENIVLSNVQIGFDGGGTKEDTNRTIPEQEDRYPEGKMFGTLPAYGFYCRHAKGLEFHHVRVQTTALDLRHALVCDDVEELLIDDFGTRPAADAAPDVCLIGSPGARVENCKATLKTQRP